mgnify:CR=1 FL=1
MTAFNENNVLTIKTVQIAPFRTLMTALKDILLENKFNVVREMIFPDHYDYSLNDLEKIQNIAKKIVGNLI